MGYMASEGSVKVRKRGFASCLYARGKRGDLCVKCGDAVGEGLVERGEGTVVGVEETDVTGEGFADW